MGMIGHLQAISTEELTRFLECSTEDEIASLLYIDGELYTSENHLDIDKALDCWLMHKFSPVTLLLPSRLQKVH